MKKYKKKGMLAHSCTAIGIGLMAWIAGTVAITLLQMMDEARTHEKKEIEA